jgi:hypothetical protein
MYIVGQERRLVNPPSQVVAGVRTVTTNMNGRDALPRLSRPFAFFVVLLKFPANKIAQVKPMRWARIDCCPFPPLFWIAAYEVEPTKGIVIDNSTSSHTHRSVRIQNKPWPRTALTNGRSSTRKLRHSGDASYSYLK